MPPQLRALLAEHDLHEEPELLESIRSILQGMTEADRPRVDASVLSTDELKALVNSVPVILANHEVWVSWPAEKVAVRMPVDLLVGTLDDWWYPAQDDLVVTDGTRHLLIDHEETVTWW